MQKFASSLTKIAPYMNIGTMFLGCMVVGVYGGWWLDQKFETEPWCLLAGSLLGIVSGFYHFFKIVFHLQKDPKEENDPTNNKPKD